jgi:hypothetical protein
MSETQAAPQPPNDPNDALANLGVDAETLWTALREGSAAAARCTPLHPPMAPGFYRFSETVRSLGEQLASEGWMRRDYKNFATVVRPDGRVQIAVARGDDGTGDLAADVATRSPKGVVTTEAIQRNLSLPLDERYIADNVKMVNAGDCATWFLLHDRRDGRVFAELSRPKAVGPDGFVELWEPRISLGAEPVDPVLLDQPTEPPINSTVDIRKR